MCICIFVCVCVCTYVCMYVCMHEFLHICFFLLLLLTTEMTDSTVPTSCTTLTGSTITSCNSAGSTNGLTIQKKLGNVCYCACKSGYQGIDCSVSMKSLIFNLILICGKGDFINSLKIVTITILKL